MKMAIQSTHNATGTQLLMHRRPRGVAGMLHPPDPTSESESKRLTLLQGKARAGYSADDSMRLGRDQQQAPYGRVIHGTYRIELG